MYCCYPQHVHHIATTVQHLGSVIRHGALMDTYSMLLTATALEVKYYLLLSKFTHVLY